MTVTGYTQTGADKAFRVGTVGLDEYAGSDDTKLGLAMTYAAAQTHPPTIVLGNRDHTFTTQRTLYTGFRLRGAHMGTANSELADASMATKVQLNSAANWLDIAGGDVFDVFIGGIAFLGTSSSSFLGSSDASVFHCCHLRDLSFHGIKTVLGSQATKLLMTACTIDGWWQIQGTYNGAVHIGGSDNRLFLGGHLHDATTAYNVSGSAAGQYHYWFEGLDNSHIGALYVTTRGNWGGIRVTGSAYNASGPPTNLGMVTMHGIVCEGLDAGSGASNGSLIRIEGGICKIRDAYIGRGMVSPSSLGHTPTDAGAIHVTGGAALIDGVTYDKASAIAESVPFVYNNGGYVTVRNTFVGSKGGGWAGLPLVQNVTGTSWVDESVSATKTGGTMRQYQAVAL